MDKEYAQYLVSKTCFDYNLIAPEFSNKRSFLWKELNYLRQFCSDGDRVLDIGCGNGRLLELFDGLKVDYIGLDNSEKLIAIAREIRDSGGGNRPVKFIVGDGLNLLFDACSFNKVFSIATFHHIPSRNFRLRFLEEAKRVLNPQGLLVLTVWNLWQTAFLKYHLRHLFLKIFRKSRLDFKDIFYPWKDQTGSPLIQRYLHCFTKRELEGLVKEVGFQVKEAGFLGNNKRNIYLVAEAPTD